MTQGITQEKGKIIIGIIVILVVGYLIGHEIGGYIYNKTSQNIESIQKDNLTQYEIGDIGENQEIDFTQIDIENINTRIDKENNPFYGKWKTIETRKEADGYSIDMVKGKEMDQRYTIKKNGKEIYSSADTMMPSDGTIKNFVTKDNDWWLLYDEIKRDPRPAMSSVVKKIKLIHNGEEIKYESIISLHRIKGKVVYFFKKDKKSKIQYYINGKIHDTQFDYINNNRCCNEEQYNMNFSIDGKVTFWGITGNKINYNEMIFDM